MSFTDARKKAGMDAAATGITHVQWSANGSSETASLARTACTVKAATTANPSVVASSGALESAACSDDVTVTHFAFAADGTLMTSWNALDSSAVLTSGGKISVADGALKENWYNASAAP
jgi:hypothetical protein